MNELISCLQILGLRPGASQEDLRKAYRELVMVWHPDRFAADSPLQAKAHEKLKEINAAYDYLMQHGFPDGATVISESLSAEAEGPTQPSETEPSTPEPRQGHAWTVGMLIALIVCGGVIIWKWVGPRRHSPGAAIASVDSSLSSPQSTSAANIAKSASINSNTPTNAGQAQAVGPVSLLPLQPLGCSPERRPDGTMVFEEGLLVTEEEYVPPFTLKVIAQTDTTNIRLRYGRGMVILNWELNTSELRYHDIRDGHIVPVSGEGKVEPNVWQDIEWVVENNSCSILVNGRKRAEFTGDYQKANDVLGIATASGAKVLLRHFSVEKRGQPPVPKPPNLASNLVLHFTFDELRGNVVIDSSPYHNHGVSHGAIAVPAGKIGGAYEFRGGTNLVVVPHSPSLVAMQRTRELTLAVWLKPRALIGEFPVVLCKGGSMPGLYGGYELVLNSHGDSEDLIFQTGPYGLSTYRARGRWINKHLGEWVHVALVINAQTGLRKWYINGRRTGDESDPNFDHLNFALPVPLYVGAPLPKNHPNRGRFDGWMDDLRVYARALTSEEIRLLPGLP